MWGCGIELHNTGIITYFVDMIFYKLSFDEESDAHKHSKVFKTVDTESIFVL
jgi:hypothetical protein